MAYFNILLNVFQGNSVTSGVIFLQLNSYVILRAHLWLAYVRPFRVHLKLVKSFLRSKAQYLLCIWKTDGFAWLYVCVSLNLVTCVFYLIYLIKQNGM